MTVHMDSFPVIVKYLKVTDSKWHGTGGFRNGLQLLNAAIDTDGASKSDFKAIKAQLNRSFEEAWKTAEGPYLDMSGSERDLHQTFSLYPQCHTASGLLKKVRAAKIDTPYVHRIREVLEEIVALAAIANPFKDKVIVREPRQDPVLTYQAPLASQTAQKAVYDLLLDITTNNFEALVTSIEANKHRIVARFTKAQTEAQGQPKDKFVSIRSFTQIAIANKPGYFAIDIRNRDILLAAFIDRKTDLDGWAYDCTDVLVLLATAKAALHAQADKEADYLRKTFIYKNMKKMDSILEAKGNFIKAEIVKQAHDLIEGETRVFFADGSAFTARTSIVWTSSIHGTDFTRYPLTFHDIVLADGTKRKMFSEEEMNTKFVGKK